MSKRKVSTNSYDSQEKTQKILDCLNKHPEGCNPKWIARETGINVNTVKTLLPKIPSVTKKMRGIYIVVNRGDGADDDPVLSDLHSWCFHNCILSGNSVFPDRDFSCDFGLVKLDVSIVSGNATARVSSDFPLNVSSLCFVAGLFAHFIGCDWDDVSVSSIEFNKDYRNLRLDGVNCISIGGLVEQFKLYQKRRGLRIEHKTRVPFSMENIVSLLSQNPMSADTLVKLDAVVDRLNNLTDAVARQQQLLLQVVE